MREEDKLRREEEEADRVRRVHQEKVEEARKSRKMVQQQAAELDRQLQREERAQTEEGRRRHQEARWWRVAEFLMQNPASQVGLTSW